MQTAKANRRILVIMGAAGLLVLLGLFGWLGPVRWLFDRTILPVTQSLVGVGTATGEAMANFTRISNLARENKALERENAELRQRLALDAETRRDNEILRRQLGLEVAGSLKQVAAEVVAFQPDSYRQFITINEGSTTGLKPGMAAMSEGVLVGVLTDVQSSTSKIMLVTDPEFRLAVKDQDTGALGVLHGQLGSGLLMDKIGQTDTVKPGDTVTTAGLGGPVPGGLFVGRVQSVNVRDNAIFQSAPVETSFKMSGLRFVFVVTAP